MQIQDLSRKCQRVLDCGCGEGTKISQMGGPTTERIGVELSEIGVLRTAKHPELIAIRADIQHLPFVDNAFPLVYSAYVMEHTTHPMAVICEMVRVTAPNGFIAILCPNYGSPFFRSPCSMGNPWWRGIRLFWRDITMAFGSETQLVWERVQPIATNHKWESDWDTTVEPALIPLLCYLRNSPSVTVIKKESFWRDVPLAPSSRSLFARVKYGIKKVIAGGPLRTAPFFRYWGPDLFVVLKKTTREPI